MNLFILQASLLFVLMTFSNCTNIKSFNPTSENTNQTIIRPPSNNLKADEKWQPATFKGLKVGESSRSDVLKALGKPIDSTFSDDNDSPIGSEKDDVELMDKYENVVFSGEINIIYHKKNNIISEIVIYPKTMKSEEIIKEFGENYKKTDYDFVECPNDAGSSRIYESKNGALKYIEYRSKGIAIQVDDSQGLVKEINFISQPLGLTSPDCSENNDK